MKTNTANEHIELLDSIRKVNKAIFNFRSTPRRDEVYGGQDDLTAAIGWESDGVTTVMFRKPASGAQVFSAYLQYKQRFFKSKIRFPYELLTECFYVLGFWQARS